MSTHYISFRKWPRRRLVTQRPVIRIEVIITNCSRSQARRIAKQEIARLNGYRFMGIN